ncbi:MAG: glycosyltransferase family 2 protein [Bacteroidetes bacterium]|nr:glycosyltransferase family 2 protein [Bacteroidota bacterium]
MINFPTVLIIIVTWNKQSYVVDLLNSLNKLHYLQDKMDIVVVDNASTDETVSILKRDFSHVHLIENIENIGGTGGFNTGLAYAFNKPEGSYEYLWLLDNDVLVHPDTLSELISVLESEQDIAIAGSTMMQLTTPWRINEMGSFVDLGRGALLHNRHLEDVTGLKGKSVQQLQDEKNDLSEHLKHCQPNMDVDYVAAASLVVRTQVAKEAGLWDDYFIHYDDVEWCLRIAKLGHRIVVSARSLIWHLPAEHKVSTWVLYYDNRNVMYMLEKHAGKGVINRVKSWIKKKGLYYTLLGKTDLARLHLEAIKDFEQGITGKKDITLDTCYYPLSWVGELLQSEGINRVLIPWAVNLQSSQLQRTFVKVMKERPELCVDYLVPPPFIKKGLIRQLPGPIGLIHVSSWKIRRLFNYWKMRNRYDLVLQSDYQPILPLNLIAKRILYVNYEGVSFRKRPTVQSILNLVSSIIFKETKG